MHFHCLSILFLLAPSVLATPIRATARSDDADKSNTKCKTFGTGATVLCTHFEDALKSYCNSVYSSKIRKPFPQSYSWQEQPSIDHPQADPGKPANPDLLDCRTGKAGDPISAKIEMAVWNDASSDWMPAPDDCTSAFMKLGDECSDYYDTTPGNMKYCQGGWVTIDGSHYYQAIPKQI